MYYLLTCIAMLLLVFVPQGGSASAAALLVAVGLVFIFTVTIRDKYSFLSVNGKGYTRQQIRAFGRSATYEFNRECIIVKALLATSLTVLVILNLFYIFLWNVASTYDSMAISNLLAEDWEQYVFLLIGIALYSIACINQWNYIDKLYKKINHIKYPNRRFALEV